jgi:hypothetical protein
MTSFESIDFELSEFQDEIARLKEMEKEEGVSVHLRQLDPKNLIEEDMEIYRKFIAGELGIEELLEYKKKTQKSRVSDRIDFGAYISNKFNPSLKRSA